MIYLRHLQFKASAIEIELDYELPEGSDTWFISLNLSGSPISSGPLMEANTKGLLCVKLPFYENGGLP